jgi:hypothetical protein
MVDSLGDLAFIYSLKDMRYCMSQFWILVEWKLDLIILETLLI